MYQLDLEEKLLKVHPSEKWLEAIDQVDIWCIAHEGVYSDSYVDCLNEEEKLRFHAFIGKEAAVEFLISRFILRSVLGKYLLCDPRNIQIGYGEFHKPFLLNDFIKFNLTHSHGITGVILSKKWEVGIDVEVERSMDELDNLASMICSKREYNAFCRLDDTDKKPSFFRLWTKKEAVLKAFGQGLLSDPRCVEVSPKSTLELVQCFSSQFFTCQINLSHSIYGAYAILLDPSEEFVTENNISCNYF